MVPLQIFASFIFFVINIVNTNSQLFVLPFLVQDFFTMRHINALNIYSCSFTESKMMVQQFSDNKEIFMVMAKNPETTNSKYWFSKAMKAISEYKFGIFINLDCDFNINILKESSDNFLSNSTYEWLAWSASYEKGVETFRNFNTAINGQISLVVDGYHIYDIYKINYSTPLIVTQTGTWSKDNGFKLSYNVNKSNLQGLKLKVILVLNRLETNDSNLVERVMDRDLNVTYDEINRFTFVVHQYLKDIYNFTLVVNRTDSWGYYFPNLGHYDGGMFGALERNAVDMGFTPAEQLESRMDVVDWVPPIKKFRACFVFRHPQVFSGYMALLKPLSPAVWLCLLIAVCLSAICLTLISVFKLPDSDGNELAISSELILVVGAMAQQGLSLSSDRTPKRVIHIFVLLLSIMIYAFYGAAIVIFLLSPTPITINTIDKLINSRLEMAAEDVPYNKFHFRNRSHPVASRVYNKRLKGASLSEDKFLNLSHGVERMRTSQFAFYAHDSSIYRLIKKTFSDSEKCSLTELEAYPPFEISICVRKKFPYKELITRGIIKLRETGIVTREDNFWHTPRPECLGQEEMLSVGPGSLVVAYVIFIAGCFLSLAFLAFEHIFKLYFDFLKKHKR